MPLSTSVPQFYAAHAHPTSEVLKVDTRLHNVEIHNFKLSADSVAPRIETLLLDSGAETDDTTEIRVSQQWPDRPKKKTKKLNKRPPAAMDTQKLPSALRRNSIVSFITTSSRESSRSRNNSIDDTQRPSFSSHRLPSTPATSAEDWTPIVSASAPRLPSFRWRHRNASSYDSDGISDQDLMKLTFKAENSGDECRRVSRFRRDELQPAAQKKNESKPRASKSPPQEAPGQTQRKEEPSKQTEVGQSKSKRNDLLPTNSRLQGNPHKAKVLSQQSQNHRQDQIKNPTPLPRSSINNDGSSYVHRQRMHQQQMSIAGFQDQQAVIKANQPSPSKETTTDKTTGSKEELPLGEEMDRKLLGFRRRSKPPVANFWTQVEEREDTWIGKIQAPFRARRDSISSSTRGHSRTRTAPAQLVNTDILLKPVIPRDSSTSSSTRRSVTLSPQMIAPPTHNPRASISKEASPLLSPTPKEPPVCSLSRPHRSHSPRNSISQESRPGDLVLEAPPPLPDLNPRRSSFSDLAPSPQNSSGRASFEQSTPSPVVPGPCVESPQSARQSSDAGSETLLPPTSRHSPSITRSHSNPSFAIANAIGNPFTSTLPNLDFLPELKHQPLPKPKRLSVSKHSPPVSPTLSNEAPPSPTPDLTLLPKSPLRSSPSRSPTRSTGSPSRSPERRGELPLAKRFVICCHCQQWHDLPSKTYEALTLSRTIGAIDRGSEVKCPWCEHGMSTACCEGWTGMVSLMERHH